MRRDWGKGRRREMGQEGRRRSRGLVTHCNVAWRSAVCHNAGV